MPVKDLYARIKGLRNYIERVGNIVMTYNARFKWKGVENSVFIGYNTIYSCWSMK